MSDTLSTSQYIPLGDFPSDLVRRNVEDIMETRPLMIYNRLPVRIEVIQEMEHISHVGWADPRDVLVVKPGVVKTGSILHFRYHPPSGAAYFVAPSYVVRRYLGDIAIGSVISAQGGYKRDIHPNGDISSIKINNMLPWPIIVQHNGANVGYVTGNTYLGDPKNHGNFYAAPKIYFDNGNMGLKLGDKFSLVIDSPDIPTGLYSFVISDLNVSEVFIGATSGEIDSNPRPEIHMYRLGPDAQFPRTHNAVGTDQVRQGLKGTSNRVPIAKYKGLNGHNTVRL